MTTMNSYSSKVKCRMEYNQYKLLFLIILFLILSVKTSVTNAQILNPSMKGLTASFGTRSFSLTSDIEEINNMNVLEEGGSIGFIIGNELFVARVYGAGFYYSAARTPRTVNLFQMELLTNYYVLRNLGLVNSTVQPYLVSGLSQDFIKFHGNYLNNPEGRPVNNSVSEEPLLGRILQTRATVGLGLEWNIEYEGSFIKLFAETRYGTTLSSRADSAFRNTQIKNGSSINVGVSFGILK